MEEVFETKNIGLRGIKVADTRISDVDGEKGILIYRGFNIIDLAQSSTFEEVSFLLLHDRLPTQEELNRFQSELASERKIPPAVLMYMKMLPTTANPMDVLQSAVPVLGSYDAQLREETKEANLKKALRLIAKLPSLVAAWDRIRNGNEPVPPHPALSHAGNFLYMLSESLPDPDTARDFDICLILHAEHSFNASTFAGTRPSCYRPFAMPAPTSPRSCAFICSIYARSVCQLMRPSFMANTGVGAATRVS